jgi:hypothetical protein
MKPSSNSTKKYPPPTGIRRSQRLLMKGIYTDSYLAPMQTIARAPPSCGCQGCFWDVLSAKECSYRWSYDYLYSDSDDSDDSSLTDEDIDNALHDMEKFDDY